MVICVVKHEQIMKLFSSPTWEHYRPICLVVSVLAGSGGFLPFLPPVLTPIWLYSISCTVFLCIIGQHFWNSRQLEHYRTLYNTPLNNGNFSHSWYRELYLWDTPIEKVHCLLSPIHYCVTLQVFPLYTNNPSPFGNTVSSFKIIGALLHISTEPIWPRRGLGMEPVN
jgi:hypothetical protein